uniref:Uncharacterized protein n=1 Tax=Lotharella globosa TaxID=91324 RepID=A0A6V3RI73_9EUKA|mmetsp:Transcript_18356/g.35380  ORF Transcript_18356/g.35380 Transcript_18356/m.35380 type:complete len:127 (+) Transcript_18356:76-456(+)
MAAYTVTLARAQRQPSLTLFHLQRQKNSTTDIKTKAKCLFRSREDRSPLFFVRRWLSCIVHHIAQPRSKESFSLSVAVVRCLCIVLFFHQMAIDPVRMTNHNPLADNDNISSAGRWDGALDIMRWQ